MKNNKIFAKIVENVKQLYNKNKKLFFATIALVVVVIFIMFLPLQGTSTKNDDEPIINESTSKAYADQLETKIKKMLLKVSSITVAEVLVMVDSSPTVNYLTQKESTKTTNSSGESFVEKEEVVYEKNGSSQVPVEVSTSYPKVTGVLLVINKIDASTKISLQNAVAGVLNIDPACIFILQDR